MQKILIVEDERRIARYLQLELSHEGYEIEIAPDGKAALELYAGGRFDLIVLDIMLPEVSGLDVLREIRTRDSVPILLLTAKDELPDKVRAFDLGADDYITKPFAIEELLARIRVALKRAQKPAEPEGGRLARGPLVIDLQSREASLGEEALRLTKKEFDLLLYMMRHENTALTRDTLLAEVWGYHYVGDTNVVDVYIRYLRLKLESAESPKFLHTVRGVGYMFRYEA